MPVATIKQRDINDYTRKYVADYQNESFETVLAEVRKRQVIQSVNRYPHQTLLEVGCGFEPIFPNIPDAETCVVIDPSNEFLRFAEKQSGKQKRVTFLHGNLEDLANELASRWSFDFIIVSGVLHEVPDPGAFLTSLSQIAGSNTIIHLNVPNVRSFHRLLALEMGLIQSLFDPSERSSQLQQHQFFDRQLLTELSEKSGFQVVNFATYLIKPFTHSQMEEVMKSGHFPNALISGLEKMAKYLPDMGCEMSVELRKNS